MKQKISFLLKKPFTNICLILLLIAVLFPSVVLAHRLNVFARIENNQIIVQASFAKNRPARNAEVKVFNNADHALLLQAQTDNQGVCTFPLPAGIEGQGITVQVNAGQGHMNTWVMGKENFTSVTAAVEENPPQGAASESHADPLTAGQIRQIFREELERAMLKNEAASVFGEPGLREIIGGLGWIALLAAICFWYQGWRKRKQGK